MQNTSDIRSLNKKRILEYIIDNAPVEKKIISNAVGLSAATVSNLCNQMIQEGLLVKTSSKVSCGGRVPEIISINVSSFSSKYIISVNMVRQDELECAILNLNNSIIGINKSYIHAGISFSEYMELCENTINNLLSSFNADISNVIGIGVAVPGIFNHRTLKVVTSMNKVIEDSPICDVLSSYYNKDVWVENDSTLCALACAFRTRCKDLIYVYMGEGLGIGIVSKNHLICGHNGLGTEVAHMPIGNRKFSCYCGNNFCAEAELLQSGFLKKYYEDTGKNNCKWEELLKEAHLNGSPAQSIFAENGMILGKLISIVSNIFNPTTVYIGGISSETFNLLMPHVDREVQKRQTLPSLMNMSINHSNDYNQLLLMGCSQYVFENWNP